MVAVIIVSLIAFVSVLLFSDKGSYVTVMINGKEYGRYSLSEDAEILIVNPIDESYINVLVIKGGEAYISEANCPDEICTHHVPVSYGWQSIACLPHKLAITVSGDKGENDVDIGV